MPGNDKDDLMQECRIIGLALLPFYDPARGDLESFLYVALSNRLRNLIKQLYYDYDKNTENSVNHHKKRVRGASYVEGAEAAYIQREFDYVDSSDIMEKMDRYVAANYRKDYKRIIDGRSVKTSRKRKILDHVRNIYLMIVENREDELDENWQTD